MSHSRLFSVNLYFLSARFFCYPNSPLSEFSVAPSVLALLKLYTKLFIRRLLPGLWRRQQELAPLASPVYKYST